MKTKLVAVITAVFVIIALYSFKSRESESSNVALVMAVDGKGDNNEGYLIIYGDGSTEMVPFEMKMGSGKSALTITNETAKIMNKLHDKDYRYAGTALTPNSTPAKNFSYLIFEKK